MGENTTKTHKTKNADNGDGLMPLLRLKALTGFKEA